MEFSWDPKKAARNLKDHKVSFEEAATIFGDTLAITFNDPDHSAGEHRLLTFGVSPVSRLPVVSHMQRGIHIGAEFLVALRERLEAVQADPESNPVLSRDPTRSRVTVSISHFLCRAAGTCRGTRRTSPCAQSRNLAPSLDFCPPNAASVPTALRRIMRDASHPRSVSDPHP
jgi:uncharacterized protein